MKNQAKTVCTVVLEQDNKYLFVQQAKEPYKGKWGLPGGHVELQESIENSIKREVFEETGYEISLLGIIGLYTSTTPNGNWVTNIAYQGEVIGGKQREKFDNEISDIGWFDFGEISLKNLHKKLRFPDEIVTIKHSQSKFLIPLDYHVITERYNKTK